MFLITKGDNKKIMTQVIGIDLGTTNSVISILEGGDPKIIANKEGDRTTPSIVSFDKDGKVLVGNVAKNQAITNPTGTISSIKRDMGTNKKIKINDKEYLPQEISAKILTKLKKDAEDYLGREVKEAVITVPAYFNDKQRTATKEAGQIAGLDILRIINEPTSAAIAYGLDKSESNQKILVFDLGGGTFDVSVLELQDSVLEVLATNGDTNLGGDDWDKSIIDWIIEKFKSDKNIDLSQDPIALQRLKEGAEVAKIELSQKPEAQINLPYISAGDSGPLHLDYTLTRSTFEDITRDLLKRCEAPFKQAISDSKIETSNLDQILLVGGSTRMPAVEELVEKLSGKKPNKGVNPDEVVAIGAAIQAGILKGDVTDLLLLDVTPLTLGIETEGGISTPLIEKNTTIPTKRSEKFTTAGDNQASVDINVLQGERKLASENKSIGKFELDKIPPAPRGVPEIEVTFDIDANGIVNVSAVDKATGNKQHITITGQGSLGDDEIEKMIKDAEAHAEEDEKIVKTAEIKNKANSTINNARTSLDEYGDKLPKDKKEQIDNKIELLKNDIEKDDIDTSTVENLIQDIQTNLQEIGNNLYKDASKTKQSEDEEEIVEAEIVE